MTQVSIDELRNNIAVSELPDEHLQWLIDHSVYEEYEDGDIIGKFGSPSEVMWINLEGKVSFYMNVNGRQVYYITFENNDITGGVGGLLPYSRMKTYPGTSYAMGKVRLLRLHKDHFHELETLNPAFIQKLIGYMTERAKIFATTKLQHEKVDALGKLAAGIAHELNNPSSAIKGIAADLTERLNRNYELTEELIGSGIEPEDIRLIRTMVKEKSGEEKQKLSTSKRMVYEDELDDWLNDKGLNKREIAETFAEYGFKIEELESLHSKLGNEHFLHVLPWIENLISSEKVISDLDHAAGRISDLVGAIKSHVHMDRTNELQLTDVHKDLDNTLTLMGFKLREKNIEIVKHFNCDMPRVPAYVGELNQVWTNLIDNAVFAMDKNGTLTVETTCDGKTATVCISDTGAGIPAEILSRIFDPFFTTKKTGEGTGIGLDIVNRIVKRHEGEIKVKSSPGHTEFKVIIPLQKKPESKINAG
jgi:signal transduction histidine kinase